MSTQFLSNLHQAWLIPFALLGCIYVSCVLFVGNLNPYISIY